MKKIVKYSCSLKLGQYQITVPDDFQLLAIDQQFNNLSFWGLIDADTTPETTVNVVDIFIYYTGDRIFPDLVYIKTIQQEHTGTIFHVFTTSKGENMKLLK